MARAGKRMRFIVVRHAKSEHGDESLDDHERPLSTRGVADAARLGSWLAEHAAVDEVLCSSATRARQTWAAISQALPAPQPKVRFTRALYLPTLPTLVRALTRVRSGSRGVLVIGHDPSLEALVWKLVAPRSLPEELRFSDGLPTASATVIEVRGVQALRGDATAQLEAFVSPRSLAGKPEKRELSPRKSQRSLIDKRTTRHELASLAIGDAVDQLRANARGVLETRQPEFVHQQRVGVRRLRVHLSVFRSLVGGARARALSEELRWLFSRLGELRDLEVLASSTLPKLGPALSRAQHERLERVLSAEVERKRERLVKALRGKRYAALVRALVLLQVQLAHRESREEKVAYRWLGRRLERRRRRALALSARVHERSAEALHDLRKELKKLRYAAELSRGALAQEPTAAFLGRLSELQDALGEWNDAVVAEQLLARLLEALPARERKVALEACSSMLKAKRDAMVEKLDDQLEALAAERPFWRE